MWLVMGKQQHNNMTLHQYPVVAYPDKAIADAHCKEANIEEYRLQREVLLHTDGPNSVLNKWDPDHSIPAGIRVLYTVIELPTYSDLNHFRLTQR